MNKLINAWHFITMVFSGKQHIVVDLTEQQMKQLFRESYTAKDGDNIKIWGEGLKITFRIRNLT